MKSLKIFAVILAAVAMTYGSAVRAEDATEKKAEKKPCCEATVEAGKKCEHECCSKAAADGKVCEKCHPKKDGDKKEEKKEEKSDEKK